MKQVTFPISAHNVAEVVAERDAEIERLTTEMNRLRSGFELIKSIGGRHDGTWCANTAEKVLSYQQQTNSGEDHGDR